MTKAFQFKGFASRSEYGWGMLAVVAYQILVTAIAVAGNSVTGDPGVAISILIVGFALAVIPVLSLTWRRLHDAGVAGPWTFLLVAVFAIGSFLGIGIYVEMLIIVVITTSPTRKERHRKTWDVAAVDGMTGEYD